MMGESEINSDKVAYVFVNGLGILGQNWHKELMHISSAGRIALW